MFIDTPLSLLQAHRRRPFFEKQSAGDNKHGTSLRCGAWQGCKPLPASRALIRAMLVVLKPAVLVAGLLLVMLGGYLMPGYAAAQSDPPDLPSGNGIVVTGSVALANLITLWAEDFRERNPAVVITVADPGTAVGIEALLNGSADLVLTSMPLTQSQKNRFSERFGYLPSYVPVARDGVALYVNLLNPLQEITFLQLDAVYSATRRCGARQAIRKWSDLGVKGSRGERMITPLGLTSDTGAYLLFKHFVLCDGDFRADFQALAGPAAVQAALAGNPAAIGFSSSALRSADVRAVAVARREGETALLPSIETIQNGRYPLTRTLGIMLNIAPDEKPNPGVQEFLDYVRSAAGQAIAAKAGYVPLPR